jgi:hypothetical protein
MLPFRNSNTKQISSKVRRGVWLSCTTLSVQVVACIIFMLAVPRLAQSNSSGSQSAVLTEAKQKLTRLEIPFIGNQGQSDKKVKFYARTFGGTVFVTETGELVYSLSKVEGDKRLTGVALKEELIGAKIIEIKGESQPLTKLNYFKGNDTSKWQSNIPTYNVVSLGEVYEGIEVKLKAYGNNVEKLFYIKPGAEPETIKIKLSGGKGAKVNENGDLEVETDRGPVKFSKPVAFQEDGGKKELMEAAYVVWGNEYGFSLGEYDRSREVIIDPILAATFLGGSDSDAVATLALDSTGNVYVAGFTFSSDFPGVGPGSADSTFAQREGEREAFVAKLNSDLSSILAATFLGGGNLDQAFALALDSTGNVYVAGDTLSSDFPGVGPGSADSTFAGDAEAFVAKLNSDLSSILAATFLGGSNFDQASTLALDSTGNVYVAGNTLSSDFPGVGPGSADSTFAGDAEAFVAKLNSDLSSILAATFLGGSDSDAVATLTLDSTGNVYVAGRIFSSSDFPGVGLGSADNIFAGGDEGFVVKLDANLSAHVIVNDLVTFNPIRSTFNTSSETTGCPSGFVGTFSFAAMLESKADSPTLSDIAVRVTILTNGNLLQNADGGPGGVGALLTIPKQGSFSDEVLSPEESVDVPFVICLRENKPFTFFVDVVFVVD